MNAGYIQLQKIISMLYSATNARRSLIAGTLSVLFIEELGWDRHVAELNLALDHQTYLLQAIAVKRGVVAYQCSPGADGAIPLMML